MSEADFAARRRAVIVTAEVSIEETRVNSSVPAAESIQISSNWERPVTVSNSTVTAFPADSAPDKVKAVEAVGGMLDKTISFVSRSIA